MLVESVMKHQGYNGFNGTQFLQYVLFLFFLALRPAVDFRSKSSILVETSAYHGHDCLQGMHKFAMKRLTDIFLSV